MCGPKGLAEAGFWWHKLFLTIFGRTDLRIGVSGAKFDAEVDFEVRFAPAPPKLDKNLDLKFRFSQFLRGFGGARGKRTSKSASASNFAPDTPILRSVRPKIVKKEVSTLYELIMKRCQLNMN